MDIPRLAILSRALQSATDFVSLGTIICEQARALFAIQQCRVTLVSHGRTVCSIDDAAQMADAERIAYGAGQWFVDPHFHVTPEVRWVEDALHARVLPLFAASGLVGALELGRSDPFGHELAAELSCAATLISVRMAQLGIEPSLESNRFLALTHRQAEVAQLAALGSTNHEIGDVLGVSANTVKKHLKDIFDRLGTANRTELAGVLARSAPRDGTPRGITRRGRLTITKAA